MGGAEPEEAGEGQLNAGRIMERSRSSLTSSQDFSEHLFGSSTGPAAQALAIHMSCVWQLRLEWQACLE